MDKKTLTNLSDNYRSIEISCNLGPKLVEMEKGLVFSGSGLFGAFLSGFQKNPIIIHIVNNLMQVVVFIKYFHQEKKFIVNLHVNK